MADTRPVVFCSWGFPEAGISLLREHFNVHVWDGPDGAPREVLLRELADGAAAVLALPPSDRLNPEAMAIAPNLKVISGFGVGFDYVDVAEATKRGIAVCNTPGTLTETTADQAWALMLGMARHVPKGDRYVRSGEWKKYEPALLLGTDIHGATLGVIGMGAIGTAVARRGKGFGMRILYSGRTRRLEAEAETGATYVPMDELLAQSDFVSINCALNAETRGLIGSRELGLMKRTAILVNSARGAIVKQPNWRRHSIRGRLPGRQLMCSRLNRLRQMMHCSRAITQCSHRILGAPRSQRGQRCRDLPARTSPPSFTGNVHHFW
jgi:glyoxylate reductase